MDKKKLVLLVIVLAVIVGAIGYLESMKAGPRGGGAPAGQARPVALGTTPGASSSAVASALVAIAAGDRSAGDPPAVEIADPTGFVNATSGFDLAQFVGKKVVLLDFWTYSCINCVRTIPYLDAWYAKYADEGLEIVGIHTPEFDFEKELPNVQAAVAEYGIHYPVVLDSDYGTWDAYNNLYWPSEYLIDVAGYVVHTGVGEGNYAETEAEIQKLLAERDQALGVPDDVSTGTVAVAAANLNEIESPETYFGSNRNDTLADGAQGTPGVQNLRIPAQVSPNELYLGGSWNFAPEYASNVAAGGEIVFPYDAGKVYFVASAAASTTIEVLQDGKPLDDADAGSDVHGGALVVKTSRLYDVVNNADGGGAHTLELIIRQPGLEAFTFTFG